MTGQSVIHVNVLQMDISGYLERIVRPVRGARRLDLVSLHPDRTVRVADQGNLARVVVAISSVVVAACAVAVTVKVLSADDVVTIRQERVLDQTAVQQAVAADIQGLREEPVRVLSCPGSVVVKAGTKFTCKYLRGNMVKDAEVEVVDDQGNLDVKP